MVMALNNVYIWLKALHLMFMVAWFAGLFYLPRLFVYHAMADDKPGIDRFKIMERKLYLGIMSPAALLTISSGITLVSIQGLEWIATARWLHYKLGLVVILVAYHLYLGYQQRLFARDVASHSHVFYRWLNEFPVLILIGAIILAVVKPF